MAAGKAGVVTAIGSFTSWVIVLAVIAAIWLVCDAWLRVQRSRDADLRDVYDHEAMLEALERQWDPVERYVPEVDIPLPPKQH
jgi:type VI protein secretion system component VasK